MCKKITKTLEVISFEFCNAQISTDETIKPYHLHDRHRNGLSYILPGLETLGDG